MFPARMRHLPDIDARLRCRAILNVRKVSDNLRKQMYSQSRKNIHNVKENGAVSMHIYLRNYTLYNCTAVLL
jgi:hypothetical protein